MFGNRQVVKRAFGIVASVMILAPAVIVAQNTFPATGNVGIGTASPTSPLQVTGTIMGWAFDQTATDTFVDAFTTPQGANMSYTLSNYGLTWEDYSGGTIGPSAVLSGYGGINFYTTANRRMTITSNGNVGIGTTSPKVPLQVNSTASANTINEALRLFNAYSPSGNNIPGIVFTNSTAADPLTDTAQSWALSTLVAGGPSYFQLQFKGGSNALITPFYVNSTGSVGIGTTSPGSKLEVNGNLKLTSGSGAAITYADGTTQTTAWTGVLCGGDYAESVGVTGARNLYEPGDLIVVDPAHSDSFAKSSEPYSTLVAGIYSTKPGVTGKRSPASSTAPEIPMAMIGIVPAKVSAENGPIKPGDLLVTSSTLGYAMRGSDPTRMTGAVVGKALGSLKSGTGVVDVLVTLQ